MSPLFSTLGASSNRGFGRAFQGLRTAISAVSGAITSVENNGKAFYYTNAVNSLYTLDVNAGETLNVAMIGARGGRHSEQPSASPPQIVGGGGIGIGEITIQPSWTNLYGKSGGQGSSRAGAPLTPGAVGGQPGGGNSGNVSHSSSSRVHVSGGGITYLSLSSSSTSSANIVCCVGGSGGYIQYGHSGYGGGFNQNGGVGDNSGINPNYSSSAHNAGGGTLASGGSIGSTAGGIYGTFNAGTNGSYFQGGTGGDAWGTESAGSGGGGGYYGGAGGNGTNPTSNGGGGSGYFNTSYGTVIDAVSNLDNSGEKLKTLILSKLSSDGETGFDSADLSFISNGKGNGMAVFW